MIMSPSINFRTASSDPKRDFILYDQGPVVRKPINLIQD